MGRLAHITQKNLFFWFTDADELREIADKMEEIDKNFKNALAGDSMTVHTLNYRVGSKQTTLEIIYDQEARYKRDNK